MPANEIRKSTRNVLQRTYRYHCHLIVLADGRIIHELHILAIVIPNLIFSYISASKTDCSRNYADCSKYPRCGWAESMDLYIDQQHVQLKKCKLQSTSAYSPVSFIKCTRIAQKSSFVIFPCWICMSSETPQWRIIPAT